MRTWIGAAAIALGLSAGQAAQAGDQPVVVELFTSQGCSSCPPADKLLGQLAQRPDVIALALHVDYWDYIGWKDVFAQPSFTKRQKYYAKAAGARTIYTPQLIVGGKDHVVGYRPMEVADLIQAHRATQDQVAITATHNGEMLRISAKVVGQVPGDMVVQLAHFSPKEDVDIIRGENAGHTFTYYNIVRSWEEVGTWDGTGPLEIEVKSPGKPGAVILQKAGHGPVVAAARFD